MTAPKTYPPLPDETERMLKQWHDQYLVKHFNRGTPQARLRSMRNFLRRQKVSVPPEQASSLSPQIIQIVIDRGGADGIAPDTLYSEIKALKAFIAWQSEISVANGKPPWKDYTLGVKLPDGATARPARRRKEKRRKELFLTLTDTEQRHLEKRATETGGTRQEFIHQLIERDMVQQDLETARKLLDSNRKQVSEIVQEASDDIIAEITRLRALLEQILGGQQ
jgi:hypothetical protein